MRKVIICAHLGLVDSAPENTLAAFEGALEQGMAIEFDIQRTVDGRLVIVHDQTVDRTTDGTGEIAQLTLAELKALDAGSWFGHQFASQRVPTFDEVLDLVKSHRAVSPSVALDVKRLSSGIIRMIKDCLDNHELIEDVICIGAGVRSADVRSQFHEASSRFQCAVVAESPKDIDAALNDVYSTWVYARFVPTDEDVLQVNRGRKRMFVCGVEVALDVNGAHEACKAGADMVLTWHPSRLSELVGLRQGN